MSVRQQGKNWANTAFVPSGILRPPDPLFLRNRLGKMGDVIYAWANGHDDSPVTVMGEEAMIKSIGNSTTTPRDLVSNEDVSLILYVMCESVAMRLREHGLECQVVEISVRDNELFSFVRQAKQPRPTALAYELHRIAMELFRKNYSWERPIRSIGMRGAELTAEGGAYAAYHCWTMRQSATISGDWRSRRITSAVVTGR